ncbi:MAG: DUF4159 domain-containing protein [Planctomycetes bacterium]|nr:DUF4159 domain-containing protein [Planctomycetota bacterium]
MKQKLTGSLLALALFAPLPRAGRADDDVTTADVKHAIDRGIAYLRSQQMPDGAWVYEGGGGWTPGATALAVYALVHTGVDPNDAAVQRGVAYLLQQPLNRTYIVSLTLIAMAAVDPVKYGGHIKQAAKWLQDAQLSNGQWTYDSRRIGRRATGDNSNTQFAVLALREAARAGVSVSQSRWSKISAFYRKAQMKDGGWGYTMRGGSSYGSMTAAGVCGLAISSHVRQNCPSQCGLRRTDRNLEKGIQWLAANFTVTDNPQAGGKYYYYYMYALERVGVLAGRRTIGGRDWYREGAAQLVQRQGGDGHWGYGVTDTCFALLFFGKGGAPLVVNKLNWGEGWNNDPNDMANLTKFYSKVTKNPVGWEAVDIRAPLTDWLRAPILYFNGHDLPKIDFPDGMVQKLRDYIDQGGFIFAEACCGRSAFDRGFRALVKRMYPEDDLVKLDPDHPIYFMRYKLTGNVPELWGLNTGCRISLVYSPTDLSCQWEMERWQSTAFKLGVNIISYATGDEPLRGKLDKVVIGEKGEAPKPPPRGAFVIAQVRHGSDWNTDPLAMTKLMLHLRESAGFDVGNKRKVVMLSDPDLFDYPVLYMTSHGRIRLSKEDIDRLRTYLERGGFLFSDACCGKSAYDASFRELVKQLFPNHPLAPLPATHPIFGIGGKIDRVQYKPKVLEEEPGKSKPELEGVTINGRTCIVYSKYDLTCAIHGHPCPGCRGVVKKDALRLATNIVLYAMTY